jgi:F0F1-type ATP synthase membrane subunit c/vacuolar-type H+-ATPase subunit K
MNEALEKFRVSLSDGDVRTLQIIPLAMCAGVVMFAFVILVILRPQYSEIVPTADDTTTIMFLTLAHLALFLSTVTIAPIIITGMLQKQRNVDPQGAIFAIRSNLIVRWAIMEAPALFGLVICFLATLNGVLNTQPIYYLNLFSMVYFLVVTLTKLPNRERLEAIYQENFVWK